MHAVSLGKKPALTAETAAMFHLQFAQLLDGFFTILVSSVYMAFQILQVHLELLPGSHSHGALFSFILQFCLHLPNLRGAAEASAFQLLHLPHTLFAFPFQRLSKCMHMTCLHSPWQGDGADILH